MSLNSRIRALERVAGSATPNHVTIFFGVHYKEHQINRHGHDLTLMVPVPVRDNDPLEYLSVDQRKAIISARHFAIIEAQTIHATVHGDSRRSRAKRCQNWRDLHRR